MGVVVSADEIRELMRKALERRNIVGEYADFIISDYMESEMEGHKTHGLSKFLTIDIGIGERSGDVKVLKQEGCFAKIDGNRELGHIAALYATNLAIQLAEKHGVGVVALSNNSRYSRITPYGRKIANEGYIGIISNNGGPACVAPFGGTRGIFGTNPICFSFPSNREKPYVFDLSTAQRVWGEVRQAIVENRPLPENSFIDDNGNFTTDPHQAAAGIPFGGPKGFAMCYALEVLTGALIGAKMGTAVKDEYDLGYLFIVLSPNMFSSLETFRDEMDKMAEEVRQCPPMKPGGKVFVPGEVFKGKAVSDIDENQLDVEEDVYRRLRIMSESLEGGYENSKHLN